MSKEIYEFYLNLNLDCPLAEQKINNFSKRGNKIPEEKTPPKKRKKLKEVLKLLKNDNFDKNQNIIEDTADLPDSFNLKNLSFSRENYFL